MNIMPNTFYNPRTKSTFKPIDIDLMIISCDEASLRLSKWEQDFIESIREQWIINKTLSEKQLDVLERIYSEKTN